jgi:multidrug efflux pump subunit AcrA (membrane-fusion protein)
VSADHDDLIRDAEEKLAEANAEVARLRAQLAAEQENEKVRLTAEDGRAEARRRVAERAGRVETVIEARRATAMPRATPLR